MRGCRNEKFGWRFFGCGYRCLIVDTVHDKELSIFICLHRLSFDFDRHCVLKALVLKNNGDVERVQTNCWSREILELIKAS